MSERDMLSHIQKFTTWEEFREKYGLHDMIGIHTYAMKLLEDIRLPKYAPRSKIKTIVQVQELRDLLPDNEEGMRYREAIDIQVLKFNM